MDFIKSIAIAASGLRAQAGRMRVIAENIANADSTSHTAGAEPYRRKIPTFRTEMDRELDARSMSLYQLMREGIDLLHVDTMSLASENLTADLQEQPSDLRSSAHPSPPIKKRRNIQPPRRVYQLVSASV